MLKPEQVPECVWRAAMSTYHKTLRKNPSMAWQEAVVAMVNAWPNRVTVKDDGRRQTYIIPAIILPLTEASDGK